MPDMGLPLPLQSVPLTNHVGQSFGQKGRLDKIRWHFLESGKSRLIKGSEPQPKVYI
jgi:hypothetical protein